MVGIDNVVGFFVRLSSHREGGKIFRRGSL